MIFLQAMMALPFYLFAFLVLLFVSTFLFIVGFNYLQPKFFPTNPRYIPWFWMLVIPIGVIVLTIIYLTHSDALKIS